MIEALTAISIILNIIRPPQPYPYQQPQLYPTQRYYYEQTQIPNQANYPVEYQTPMGRRNWSQAGQETYRYGQPTQTSTYQNGG